MTSIKKLFEDFLTPEIQKQICQQAECWDDGYEFLNKSSKVLRVTIDIPEDLKVDKSYIAKIRSITLSVEEEIGDKALTHLF